VGEVPLVDEVVVDASVAELEVVVAVVDELEDAAIPY
jgi:hypothetical protein